MGDEWRSVSLERSQLPEKGLANDESPYVQALLNHDEGEAWRIITERKVGYSSYAEVGVVLV
jgi:hypothetical protein